MPIYTYLCDACKKHLEIEQKISAEPEIVCPECGKEALKRVPPKEVSIQFKGSGFYKTDYTQLGKEKPSNDKESSGGCGSGSCGCGKK
jgi:putative FmdB family regulatory protein